MPPVSIGLGGTVIWRGRSSGGPVVVASPVPAVADGCAVLAQALEVREDRRVEPAAGEPRRAGHDRDGLAQPPRDGDRPVRPGEAVERRELAVVPEPGQREVHGVELGPDDRPGGGRGLDRRGVRQPDVEAQRGPERPALEGLDAVVRVGGGVGHRAISRPTRRSWRSTAARTSRPTTTGWSPPRGS